MASHRMAVPRVDQPPSGLCGQQPLGYAFVWRPAHGGASTAQSSKETTGMLVYLGVTLWAILLATRVYRYDLYHKAPRPILFAALAGGYVAMWLLSDLEDWTWDAWGGIFSHGAGRAFVAATHEEFAKV